LLPPKIITFSNTTASMVRRKYFIIWIGSRQPLALRKASD
jgi:hypothetical protein